MHVEASGVATFRVNATGQKVSVSASDLEWDCQGTASATWALS